VAYHLEIPDHVAAYLDGPAIPEDAREKIADALEYVADLPAEFRADPTNRFPGSTLLRYVYAWLDGEGRVHTITLAIDDPRR